jgi:hypothetical protein
MNQIPQTYRTTYRDNVQFLLQQGDSKLLPTVTTSDGSGELHKLTDQVGDTKHKRKKSRNAHTEHSEAPHDGRWVAQPDPIFESFLIDNDDQLASGIELSGTYTRVAARTIARGTDDIIIGGIFNPAQTGRKGTVLKGFDASNVVPVDEGDSGNPHGLTVEKISAAWEILAANYVDLDMEKLWMPVTARQGRQLLREVEATNKDYGARGVEIRDGVLMRLFGFEFVHIELGNPLFDNAGLTLDANGYRKVPFYTQSGIEAVFWERLFTNVDKLPDRHYSTQVYARRSVEATRTEEGKVGYILCDES